MINENEASLTNDVLELIFRVTEGRLIGGEIKNNLTGRILKTGEEFGIRLSRCRGDLSTQNISGDLVSEDFLRVEAGHRMGKKAEVQEDDFTARIMEQSKYVKASEFELLDCQKQEQQRVEQLILKFKHPGEEIEIAVTYELRADEPYLRKQLVLNNVAAGKVWVVDLDVQVFRTVEWDSSAERGYPIFIEDDFFVGLEFPAWSRIARDGELVLRHHPGKIPGPGESLTSKTAVIGVSESGAIKEQFRRYVADIALAKPGKAPVSLYNDWGSHGWEGATEKETLTRVRLLEEVKAKHGFEFDYYIVDAGWAERDDEPWCLRRRNWPEGFGKFVGKLKRFGAKFGLWMTFRCLAEQEYWQRFRDGVLDLIDRYQLGWIKFDGGVTECADPGHGHLTTFEYSQEALFEALIELLAEIRKRNPRIIIQHCWGINLSPWWVMHYDMLFCMLESIPHLGAASLPALRLRESLDVGLDQAELVRYREHFLPWHILDDDGVYILDSMAGWENNLILSCLGRGNGRVQIYAKLELLKEKDWTFLQAVRHLLQKEFSHFLPTQKVPGIPEKGEVYGYAHFSGGSGFLVLNNPSFEERTVELKLSDYLPPADRERQYRLRALYPASRELHCSPEEITSFRLSPLELCLLEVEKVEQIETAKPPVLPSPSVLPFEFSRKLSEFREDRIQKSSESELEEMLERIKFSLSDGTFSQDMKGWLDAPARARWWVNPRGRTGQMCYRIDFGQVCHVSRVEIESAGFPPEYSLFLSEDLNRWSEIGPRKGIERDAFHLPEGTARYVKLVPHWQGAETGDWGIVDIRFYQKDGEAIDSAGWFRNGLLSHRSRIIRVYRSVISVEELKLKAALNDGLLCVPLQMKSGSKPWCGKSIRGYNVPHNHIFLMAGSGEQQFVFQPMPGVGFITKGSWIAFTHPAAPLAKIRSLELIAVLADAPEAVVLDGSVYCLFGK